MFRKTQAIIHTSHLIDNLKLLRSTLHEQDFICPMIKADAYGHGSVQVAKILEQQNIPFMGVALIEEAIVLREAGIKAPVLFFGVGEAQDIKTLKQYNITPVVSTWEMLHALAEDPIEFHIKLDTGMHRLGFDSTEWEQLKAFLQKYTNLRPQGVCTHLHSGEDLTTQDKKGTAYKQLMELAAFAKACQIKHVHGLNSAGIIGVRNSGLSDLKFGIRPGLAMYGYSAVATGDLKLKPVMSFRTHFVRTHKVSKGDSVSYGHIWKCTRDSVVGVMPVGYADGYPRQLSNKAAVLFRGQRFPVCGTVCMDYVLVDLTDAVRQGEIKPDEPVTLFGYDEDGHVLGADELAGIAGTVAWNMLTGVSSRVPRVYSDTEAY